MNKKEEVEKGGEEVQKKKRRRRRRVIYKLGIYEKQNGRGKEEDGKTGRIRERIPIAFFTLVFGSLRQRELENGIISSMADFSTYLFTWQP